MNLEIIRTRTTWNDAAGSINNNYAKIADAIAQLKANGGGGGGGADIDLTDYATKVWVEAKGYITASALTPYLKTDDAEDTYATKDFVDNKLVDYAPLTSIQGFENRIGGLEGAVPTLNTKVTEVEGDVATLSEDITKVEEGLSSLEETLKTEHPTNGDLESAIVELNISQYLTKTEANITYATIASVSTLQTTVSNQAKTILANEQGLEELRTTVGDLGDAIPTNNNQLTNGAGYITSDALSPYAKTADVSITYATIASVQGFENRIAGLEGAVPQLNERVTTVEGKVSSLNETVSTGENNLLDRVNVIEEEYATKTYVDNAIGGIDLSPYLKAEDAEETYATKDFVNNKLINYATIVSVTAIQNTLTGQIGAVDARVEQLATTKLDSSYFTLTNIKSTLGISDWALAATKPSYAWSEITSRPTALSQFTDDVVAGNYLRSIQYSTEWDANAIFNAGIYSGLIANLPSGSPYGRILSLPYYFDKGSTINNFVSQLFITNGDDTTTPNEMYFRTSQRNSWNAWNKVITDNNIGNYNAGSATKLATPRTLWGQSFDGTGDVSGTLSGVSGITFTSNGTTYSSYGNPVLGSTAKDWTVYSNSGNALFQVAPNGNVGIGNTSPTERLDVSGNIKASGNINATSVTIGGVTLSWDSVNNALVVNGNMYGTGSITAKKSA